MNVRNLFANVGERLKGFFTSRKKVLATVAVCATVAASVVGLQANRVAQSAGTPRFNFMQGDVEMLQVAKTTSGSTWGDPASANIGDRVAFLFYYHNGMENTVAHNTTLRVDLPVSQGTSLKATSYLWSSETAYITDTVVNGQIVGQSGATVNVPTNARIEYVPGTTRWFPNGSQTATQMPDGIVSASGLNIGDIQGCWPYAGYVTFLADINGQSKLVMDKKVAHPGESTWHDEIVANPGDSVAYSLGIRNDGDVTATQVSVKDILPSYMTYEPGTTFWYRHNGGNAADDVQLPDTMFTTGVSLIDAVPGNVIFVSYRVHVNSDIPAGTWALNNVAKVYQAGVEKDMDQAKVTVIANRGLIIDKMVSNGVSWVEQNTAKLGDTVTYRIIVRNTGNIAVSGVYVRDILPVYVNYIAGSTKVDGALVSDQIITSAGLSLGNLAPGAQKVITLSGKIYGCPPVGGYTLVNTGYTHGTGVAEISNSATTIVNVSVPASPKF